MMATQTGRRVRWSDPLTGKRRSRTFPDENAALAFKLARESDVMLVKADRIDIKELGRQDRWAMPVEPLLSDYLRDMTTKYKRSDSYVTEVGRSIRQYLDEQRVDRLGGMDTDSVRAFLGRKLDYGWGAVTHNRCRSYLSTFCGWLVDFKYIPENPLQPIRRMDELDDDPRLPSRALTLAECDAMLAATPCPLRRAKYLLRMRTGLRVLETGRLLWSDLDLVDLVLSMPGRRGGKLVTKNKKPAVIPLTQEVCDSLTAIQRAAMVDGCPPDPAARVFPNRGHKDTFDRDVAAAGVAREINGEFAIPRGLRKTFTTHLLAAGVNPIDTLQLTRHKPPAGLALTLGVYSDDDMLLARKRESIAMLDAWVADQRADRRKQA